MTLRRGPHHSELMNYKLLGAAQIQLPEIGLGTWKYQGGAAPLRQGIELGATLIDTAESYGTEETVGEAIRGIRQKVFVATKVAPHHFRRRDVHVTAEASLRRLVPIFLDSNGQVRGPIGAYSGRYPKYFKGPNRPG